VGLHDFICHAPSVVDPEYSKRSQNAFSASLSTANATDLKGMLGQ
jgi:hypothetical protein